MNLTNDGTQCIIPDTDPAEYDPSSVVVMNMTLSVTSVYECEKQVPIHQILPRQPRLPPQANAVSGSKSWVPQRVSRPDPRRN